MSKRLVLFNHKGGVSKTTTVYNLGWKMAEHNRVLLIDADPQCNLTSLFLRDDFEKYYLDEDTKLQNIKDGVSPAFSGRPNPIRSVTCVSVPRAPTLYLLPGHANLSEYDAALTFAQNSSNALATLQNLPGAFNELLRLCEEQYQIDYTIIDLNPGLSAINQNLFLNSDAFCVPTNPDPFSIMALDTLKSVLPRWANWKKSAFSEFEDAAYPLRDGLPKFVGTFIQRFNIRNGRAARPYRDNIAEIKTRTTNQLFPALTGAGLAFDQQDYPLDLMLADYCIQEIPDFGGLLPKAHDVGVPIFHIEDEEIKESGPVLRTLVEKRDQMNYLFEQSALKVGEVLDHVQPV